MLTLILDFFLANIIVLFWVFVADYFFNYEEIHKQLFRNLIIANVLTFVLYLCLNGIFIIKEWNRSQLAHERIEKKHILSKFVALKHQLDPHFLFNSLNTLNSLIHISTEKSAAFIHHFSRIYRYVLEEKENMLVPLHREMEFVRSYFFLHKMQHEENLILAVDLDPLHLNDLVPPLSLQVLVENAIKHNEISDDNPLLIRIDIKDALLEVKNNLQPKREIKTSTNTGLKNLKERYNLVSELIPEFIKSKNEFLAKIPLIKEEE
ncbi:hypothetical protein E1171_03130 [Cytophagales bacterium RKSG123]|nr:hypothetical protein [Xanthovirga aplysinae]